MGGNMSSELTLTEEQTVEAKWLEGIKNHYRITDERFQSGLEFASLVVDGVAKVVAYETAFKCSREFAVSSSTTLFRAKWIQELIRYMQTDDSVEYISEVKHTIAVLMQIIKDPRATYREKTEASKALQPYIKQERAKLEIDLTMRTDEGSMIDKVVALAKGLANQGKMIDKSGDIVDAVLID